MNIVAVIQARMASTRLPGKVLAHIEKKPLLWYVVTRTQRARSLSSVLVATSDQSQDDAIADICQEFGISCFRGSEHDVLDRYYHAARFSQAEAIVRITADCPLIDPHVIDAVVQTFQRQAYDYVSNTMPPTFPDGTDVEVFSFQALEHAWLHANLQSQREHVTPYIINQPSLFRIHTVCNDTNLSHLRWTVDEPEDLDFVRRVYHSIGADLSFGIEEVLQLLEHNPEIATINAMFQRNEGYQKSLRKDIVVPVPRKE